MFFVPAIKQNISTLRSTLPPTVTLICVSKYHTEAEIKEAYEAGERDFGESRVQDLARKYQALPKDIRWHFIGHLQTNKVRQAVQYSSLIQSVDSLRLLEAIDKEAGKQGKVQDVLLEVHVAQETTKSGFTPAALPQSIDLPHVRVLGLMGMATNTDDEQEIRRCFGALKRLQGDYPILSMGMSDDYPIAIEEGSTMVRVGSAIFNS